MKLAIAFLPKPTATIAPIALVFCATLLSVLSLDPGKMVEDGFETALSDHDNSAASVTLASSQTSKSPIAGSESYWLGTPDRSLSPAAQGVRPVVWTKPVSIGDRIELSDTAGTAKTLEVVSIEPLHRDKPIAATASTSPTPSNSTLWLVTCRDPTAAGASVVRMIVDDATNLHWLRKAPNQAL